MSGDGAFIPSARALPLDEAARERRECRDYLMRHVIEAWAISRRNPDLLRADEAGMLTRRLRAVAEAIGEGLHRR